MYVWISKMSVSTQPIFADTHGLRCIAVGVSDKNTLEEIVATSRKLDGLDPGWTVNRTHSESLSTSLRRTNQKTIIYALLDARVTTILVELHPMSRIIQKEQNVLTHQRLTCISLSLLGDWPELEVEWLIVRCRQGALCVGTLRSRWVQAVSFVFVQLLASW